LPNAYRLTDRLYSGGNPDGDAGFASLQRLGVRTVLSVDGARPDVERARRYGLRYVHISIGYDGPTRAQALRIAKAVRDLPGPVYVHCHHGKHRGPAAAAIARRFLDDDCSADEAVAEMRRAGTDPRYTGLYAAPRDLARPTAEELDRTPDDFPEAVPPAGMRQAMVEVDETWGRLGRVRAAGWRAPADDPDLDPPHEAVQLGEHFRESARLPQADERAADFRERLTGAADLAGRLEGALRGGAAGAEEAYNHVQTSCAECHARYRDAPRR
jgi:protein tyrosine phosphatase (PTP) superfamily phosphohydrolase (DUF442 family)